MAEMGLKDKRVKSAALELQAVKVIQGIRGHTVVLEMWVNQDNQATKVTRVTWDTQEGQVHLVQMAN